MRAHEKKKSVREEKKDRNRLGLQFFHVEVNTYRIKLNNQK